MPSHIPDRRLLHVYGPDAGSFLQGMVTQDMNSVTPDSLSYSCLLTPQGRFLHDFFIRANPDTTGYWIEVAAAGVADLIRRFSLYKLRSKIMVEAGPEIWVYVDIQGNFTAEECEIFKDPRRPELGNRIWSPGPITDTEGFAAYDLERIRLAVPDGRRDLTPEKSTVAEGNLDLLGAVSYDKGCYMGQELTARVHFRGLAKRRLVPILYTGNVSELEPGLELTDSAGRLAGTVTSVQGETALALMVLDRLGEGGKNFMPKLPDWLSQKLGSLQAL